MTNLTTDTQPPTSTDPAERHVQLDIAEMTCASCAMRIEKRLNKLDGVTATVNYATEKAKVTVTGDVNTDDLVSAVEAVGYSAALPSTSAAPSGATDIESAEPDSTAPLRQRLLTSTVLAVPVILLAMIPSLQFDGWQWLSLTLAAPVVTWGAWPFHRAAWANLRHGTATMDTLISVGTIAAFSWSLYALFLGDAGAIGMRHGFSFTPERGMGSSQIYLEVAAGVTVFILAGRYFEARAKRRSGAALRALLELGAKDAAVLRDGAETRIPVEELAAARCTGRPRGVSNQFRADLPPRDHRNVRLNAPATHMNRLAEVHNRNLSRFPGKPASSTTSHHISCERSSNVHPMATALGSDRRLRVRCSRRPTQVGRFCDHMNRRHVHVLTHKSQPVAERRVRAHLNPRWSCGPAGCQNSSWPK